MQPRITSLLILLVTISLASLVPAASLAADGVAPPPLIIDEPLTPGARSGAATPTGPLTVMLELAAPPPGVIPQAQATAAGQEDVAQYLDALGIPVLFRTRVAYSGVAVAATPAQLETLRALPGVAAVRVIPPKTRSLVSQAASVGTPQFWRAAHRITGEPVLGEGVRIGIIGTGIDYTHATFGGPGTPEAYAANDPAVVEPGSFPTTKVVAGVDFVGDAYDAAGVAGSPTPIRDDDPLDCAGSGTHIASVAAGYGVDAQGATYRGPYSSSLSFADFKVAPGIAPGADLVALKIFGCAGTTTFLTAAIDYALDPNGDGVTDDRLVDVLSISLGSPFGGADDPDAEAVDRAVRAGVVVVVSVGDSGDTFYAASSPATAPLAIAVGASVDERGATPESPADSLLPSSSRGPQQSNAGLKPDLVAPGSQIPGASVGSGTEAVALSGTAVAAPQVAGAAALLRDLHPDWAPSRIKTALVTSAAPVRLPSGAPYPPSLAGGGRLNIASLATLAMLAYPADDPASAALSYGAPWVSRPLSIQRHLTIENIGDTPRTVRLSVVATASESGVQLEVPAGPYQLEPREQLQVPVSLSVQPQLLDYTPDAATAIQQGGAFYRYYMAEHGGYVQVTSSVGARVRAAHAAELKNVRFIIGDTETLGPLHSGRVSHYHRTPPGLTTIRVVTNSGADVDDDGDRGVTLLTQQVDLQEGRDYTLALWGPPGDLRLAVIDEIPPAPPTATGLIHFFNADPYGDGTPVDIYIDGALAVPGLPVGAISPYLPLDRGEYSFQVVRAGAPPGTEPVVSRTLWISAERLYTFGVFQHDVRPHRLFVADGRLVNEQIQRVPFQIFPKSAAESAAATLDLVVPGGAPLVNIPLTNTGARNGASPDGHIGTQLPLVSAFALEEGGVSPPVPGLSPNLRAADVQYVGASSNLPATGDIGANGTVVLFGIASHAAWSTPNEVEFRIYIDSNLDGAPDYVLVTTNIGAFRDTLPGDLAPAGPPNDVFITPLYQILPGDVPRYAGQLSFWNTLPAPLSTLNPYRLDAAPFNTRVMFQAVRARTLGLSAAQPRLRYFVETRARDANGFAAVVDRAPAAGYIEYDLLNSPLTPVNLTDPLLAYRPLFSGVSGSQVSAVVDQMALAERGVQRLLLLHHHNTPAAQTQVVLVRSSSPLGLRAAPVLVRAVLPMVTR
ncbi:MAG TPA: S8 family serine peptidase [Roseiflexaceae bacterium]|nr:S8 family serine peptidase [Roseiflexaceae bacterium]